MLSSALSAPLCMPPLSVFYGGCIISDTPHNRPGIGRLRETETTGRGQWVEDEPEPTHAHGDTHANELFLGMQYIGNGGSLQHPKITCVLY